MAGVRFEDVDLLGALSRIVDLHTQHYKEDFDLDKGLISKLAVSDRSEDKQLLWMSRSCGKGCIIYEIKLKQQEIMQEVGNANMLTKALIDRLINKVYVFPGDRIEIEYATQDFLETKESEKEV